MTSSLRFYDSEDVFLSYVALLLRFGVYNFHIYHDREIIFSRICFCT